MLFPFVVALTMAVMSSAAVPKHAVQVLDNINTNKKLLKVVASEPRSLGGAIDCACSSMFSFGDEVVLTVDNPFGVTIWANATTPHATYCMTTMTGRTSHSPG